MRPSRRPLIAALALGLAFAPLGCPKTDDGRSESPRRDLPDPLPLPADPVALAHVEDPAGLLALVDPWLDLDLGPTATAERELRSITTPELAETLAQAIDPERPWNAVRLGPEEQIAWVPVRAAARDTVEAALSSLPTEGNFGARVLPRDAQTSSAPLHLTWFEAESGHLAVARSLRGLATAPLIAKTYGDHPVVLATDASLLPAGLPLTRAAAHGTLDALDFDLWVTPDFDLGAELEIEPGALGGLLEDPALVAGASSRWKHHERFIKGLIADIGDEVAAQPFLVRGIFEDLARRLNAVLRSWNGRWAAGIGEGAHAYVAFGSDDPKKSGVATLRLMQSVVDNVKLARNFTQEVPRVTLRKNAGEAADEPIHTVTVGGAARWVGPARPLLDAKKQLVVAMAFSRHAGAGLVVVGPDPLPRLRAWLIASSRGPAGDEDMDLLAGAILSISPAQLRDLRADARPERLLELRSDGPRRFVTLRSSGPQRFTLELRERARREARPDAGER